jgi:hypothetical protein
MQPLNPNSPQSRQLKLETDSTLRANYSNSVVISNTPLEVVFDFIQIVPSDNRAKVVDRVIMTPAHAKMFLQALNENLGRYEAKHGVINVPPRPPSLADQLFSGVNPPTQDPEEGNNEPPTP